MYFYVSKQSCLHVRFSLKCIVCVNASLSWICECILECVGCISFLTKYSQNHLFILWKLTCLHLAHILLRALAYSRHKLSMLDTYRFNFCILFCVCAYEVYCVVMNWMLAYLLWLYWIYCALLFLFTCQGTANWNELVVKSSSSFLSLEMNVLVHYPWCK